MLFRTLSYDLQCDLRHRCSYRLGWGSPNPGDFTTVAANNARCTFLPMHDMVAPSLSFFTTFFICPNPRIEPTRDEVLPKTWPHLQTGGVAAICRCIPHALEKVDPRPVFNRIPTAEPPQLRREVAGPVIAAAAPPTHPSFICWRPANGSIVPGPARPPNIDRRMPRRSQAGAIRKSVDFCVSYSP